MNEFTLSGPLTAVLAGLGLAENVVLAKLEEIRTRYPDAGQALEAAKTWFTEAIQGAGLTSDSAKALALQAAAEILGGHPSYSPTAAGGA